MMTRNEFAYKAHENAKEKVFWQERLSNEHCLMLVITEIAEVVEADRKDERAKKGQKWQSTSSNQCECIRSTALWGQGGNKYTASKRSGSTFN